MELFADVFSQKGFNEVKVNVSDISVYVNRNEDKEYVIILFYMINGVEWSQEQCAYAEKQILEKLQQGKQIELKVITFICTNKVDAVRNIYRQNDHTGVVDLANDRLLIFENMTNDFLSIFSDMEKVLETRSVTKAQVESQIDPTYSSTNIEKVRNIKSQVTHALREMGYANAFIVGLNILIFILLMITGNDEEAVESGKLYWVAIKERHEYYRLITCMFLHGGISHLFNNMLILSVIGGILEKRVGMIKYSILYFLSGIIAGIVSINVNMGESYVGSIGASGAIFGVVGAVLWIVLVNKGRVENLSKRQMILFVIFSLYGGFQNQGVDNAAHVGGLIGGFILAMLIYRRPKKRGVVS